jgi:hypothetical protein
LLSASLRFVENNTTAVIMSNAFLNLNAEMMTLIFERDSLNDGQSEVFIYLALLRWARRSGTLDANDPSQFDTTEVLQSERL